MSNEREKGHSGPASRYGPLLHLLYFPFPVTAIAAVFISALTAVIMQKLHITQDDFGYWMMSLESEDGSLSLMAHQFNKPDHLIEDAMELMRDGTYPEAALVVSPPRSAAWIPPERLAAGASCAPYRRPEPRKAAA